MMHGQKNIKLLFILLNEALLCSSKATTSFFKVKR